MSFIRQFVRTISFAIVITLYLIISSLLVVWCFFDVERARHYLTKVVSITSKIGLRIFNIKIQKTIAPLDLKAD